MIPQSTADFHISGVCRLSPILTVDRRGVRSSFMNMFLEPSFSLNLFILTRNWCWLFLTKNPKITIRDRIPCLAAPRRWQALMSRPVMTTPISLASSTTFSFRFSPSTSIKPEILMFSLRVYCWRRSFAYEINQTDDLSLFIHVTVSLDTGFCPHRKSHDRQQ